MKRKVGKVQRLIRTFPFQSHCVPGVTTVRRWESVSPTSFLCTRTRTQMHAHACAHTHAEYAFPRTTRSTFYITDLLSLGNSTPNLPSSAHGCTSWTLVLAAEQSSPAGLHWGTTRLVRGSQDDLLGTHSSSRMPVLAFLMQRCPGAEGPRQEARDLNIWISVAFWSTLSSLPGKSSVNLLGPGESYTGQSGSQHLKCS